MYVSAQLSLPPMSEPDIGSFPGHDGWATKSVEAHNEGVCVCLWFGLAILTTAWTVTRDKRHRGVDGNIACAWCGWPALRVLA